MTQQQFNLITKLNYSSKTTLPTIILSDDFRNKLSNKKLKHLEITTVKFEGINDEFIMTSPKFFEALILNKNFVSESKKLPARIKEPDEFYLSPNKKIAFIIEKKTQNVTGSTVEKIQTGGFKKYALEQKFKEDWKVHYIYCLSDFFRDSRVELDYLTSIEVSVFWGEETNYRRDIVNFFQKMT